MLTVLSVAMHDCRFVENIPRHITPKSGFESFAEYTQCIQEGPFRLEATADIPAGEEVYVRHAPGDIQWSCFHPDECTSGTLKALYAQYGYVTVLFHCHPAMLEQVLLTTSPIVCSECYRGIHSSCLGENSPRVSCSRCIAAVRRSLDFPPSVPTSPAPRVFFFCILCKFFFGQLLLY